MKLDYLEITTKDNTTCYTTVEKHLKETFFHIKLNEDKAIANDFVAQLRVEWVADGVEGNVRIASHDVASLMDWLKETHPEVHALVPEFKIDQFQRLAENMKSSSHLTYSAVESDQEMEYEFGVDPEPDDFIPEVETVEEAFISIRANGFYTELHCYPNSPVGFWNYYGLNFQSLLDHIGED